MVALALILTHLIISTIHGLAHQGGMVKLSRFGYVYVAIVITLAPIIAGVLLFSRTQKAGALLLTLSMLGSFGFGVWYHFLTSGADNVSEVQGPWHSTFLWTAVALAIVEFAGVFIGLWMYREIGRVKNSI